MYFTKRQLEVLDFIRRFRSRHRVAPTLEEMAAHFRLSKVTILEHVRRLEAKGALRRTPNHARSIELLDAPESSGGRRALPVLGVVEAGRPSSPFEVPEEFALTDCVRDPADLHLLRVRGESMIGDDIRDGDLVLVDRRRTAREGDIVVAATPDAEVTLKRIFRTDDGVELRPSNETMPVIHLEAADVRGVVVGLVRRFR
ncbi:MAG: transcriptional repressor LexA [Planctomycetota bacterium JB042]